MTTTNQIDLISILVRCPMVAVNADDTSTWHALTVNGAIEGWPEGPLLAACGAEVSIRAGRNEEDKLTITPWPPRVKAIAPFRRCLACHKATGSKRPAW